MKPPGTNAGSGSISRLGPQFADRQPIIPRPSNAQNSNREALRRVRADDSARRNDEVTAVTQTKQRILINSNRELAAYFSPPKFDRTSGPRRGAGLLRPRFGTGFWVGVKEENSTATEGGEHPTPTREGGEAPPLRRKRREKRIYAPPGFVSIKPEADRLFCVSYGRF
jgi:hypothetical protein